MIFQTADTNNFKLKSDIQVIEDILDVSDIQLAKNAGLQLNEITNILTDKSVVASKEQMESIYNYAFNNNLYMNDLKWQMYSDEYTSKDMKVLCHGSRTMINGKLRLDANGDSNDFANGFYCR